MELINQLSVYFAMPMVQKALIVGVLISLCSSILGVNLVLKRFSYIGESLSHTAFGLMVVGTILGTFVKSIVAIPDFFVNETVFTLLATILISVLITRANGRSKIKGDALLCVMSVSSLAIGYLLLSKFSVSANLAADVCSTLFGSVAILTLSSFEVSLCIILSIVVVLIYVIFYNKIFAITFDEDFARATGVKVELYNTILSTILAVVIVLAINLVGSLLISALIIFPALSGMRIFNNFKSVIIFATLSSVVCSALGIVLSIIYGTPVGSTIVAVDLTVFLICCIINKVRR